MSIIIGSGSAAGGGGSVANGVPKLARPGQDPQPPFVPVRALHPNDADCVAFLTARDVPDWLDRGGLANTDTNGHFGIGLVPFQVVAGQAFYNAFKQGAANRAVPFIAGGNGLLSTTQWAFELPFKVTGADLSTLTTAPLLHLSCGAQSLLIQKASGNLQAILTMDTRGWVTGGALSTFTAQVAIANGDVPADTWATCYASFDGTNLRIGFNNDAKSNSVAVTTTFRTWDGGGRGAAMLALCGLTGGGSTPQPLTVGPVIIHRYARNATTGTSGSRQAAPSITVDPGTTIRTHTFQAGVVDHYYGFSTNETDAHPTERDAQMQMLKDAGCQIVRHAETNLLAVPTVDGGGNITSVDFTKLNTHYDRWGTMPIHLSAFRTPAALRSGGTDVNPPTSNTVFADYVSRVVAQIKSRYPGQLQSVALWNEPTFPSFWSGNRTQLLAMWNAVAARMNTDHPDIPFGNIDGIATAAPDSSPPGAPVAGGAGPDIRTMNEVIGAAQTAALPMPFTAIHHYESDLTLLQEEVDHLKAIATAAGFSNHKIRVTEWSFDAAYGGLEHNSDITTSHFNRRAFNVKGGAFTHQMLAYMARSTDFLSSHFYGFSHDTANGIGYGFIDDSLVNPRPFPTFTAHELFWKHTGTIVTSTANWPGVRSFATKAADGSIMVSYSMYRAYEPGRRTDVRFDWLNLPASFTWTRWHFDRDAEADGRLVKVGSGNETNLPLGVSLDGASFGGIKITP